MTPIFKYVFKNRIASTELNAGAVAVISSPAGVHRRVGENVA